MGLGLATGARAAVAAPTGNTVRDRLWIWGHYEGSHNGEYNLMGESRITPVEAAYYLSIPNAIMVEYKGQPQMPIDQYAVPFRALREVVWSVVGAGGKTADADREAVIDLAGKTPNFSGVIMDDFFISKKDSKIAALTIPELNELQSRLKGGSKKLDLWVTLYTHQLDDAYSEHMKRCDVLTLWTWKAADLKNLKSNFEKTEHLWPRTRKMLGCYMWDYGVGQPMPVSAMQAQCEQGLEWLRAGRIEGMIFLASCICDLNLEAVEWSRRWIQKVSNQKVLSLKRAKA